MSDDDNDSIDPSEVSQQIVSELPNTLPPKKQKATQKYSKHWEKQLTWLSPSTDYSTGFCRACKKDIKISAGIKDLLKHAASQKHQQNERALAIPMKSINAFANSSYNDRLRNAELQLCAWGAAHNRSAVEIEEFAVLMARLCPDSTIAKGIKLGRTKVNSIISNVVGEGFHEELTGHLQISKFSLIVDESTDKSCKKSLAMITRTYFWENSRTLYALVINSFDKDKIPYKQNMLGYAADGAKNMTGENLSLAALLKNDCPSLFVLKCVCHSFALCSSYACKHIPDYVEQLCRDIYNYLNCSPLRTSKFNEIQSLLDLTPLKMLHPSATRWLSLEGVVQRVLDRYESLKVYFGFAVNIDRVEKGKVSSIYEALNSFETKLYLSFLSYILPWVNRLNKLFQSENPALYSLHANVSMLYRTILDNFMKPEYLTNLKSLNEVKFEPPNYLRENDVYVGVAADLLIREYISEGKMTIEKIFEFKVNIIRFYITLANQIQSRINFNDVIMINMEIIDPKNVRARKHSSILPLLLCFPHLINKELLQNFDDEFREILNIDFTTIDAHDAVTFWGKVLSIKRFSDSMAFPLLRELIPSLLILPHSSAAVERLFSQFNLNKTKIRNRIGTDTMKACYQKSRSNYVLVLNYSCNCPVQEFNLIAAVMQLFMKWW
ncbi:uncharacterized protein LOC128746206 [Sabethes cyaneus]|uniref:uncharacterized protein LOC128746206 n=1 Tax=Sabethes cyaneus TaxID=53552 RepID=UPI00237DF59C|nr:uncharacterized protein LOC128746206 [Sabethes cyaneus]